MEETIVNRVSSSGLISLDLEDFYPEVDRVLYDIKDNLFMGMILKEKDFRTFLKEHDWSQYQNKHIAIFCSEDAIIPTWAYMLVISQLNQVGAYSLVGSAEDLAKELISQEISRLELSSFMDGRVIIKGCADIASPAYAMSKLVSHLQPVAKSIMYGEPCSTVPIYKRKA
jgi:hypothetical protein